jgi:single-stranded-DNA-specific exonuclease
MERHHWQHKALSPAEKDLSVQIALDCGISALTAGLLVGRGITSAEEAMAFLEPDPEDLWDPFALPDMEAAVGRLLAARQQGELVCVYGDYDADGTTAVSILLDYFETLGIRATYRIPNRLTEGYGMNMTALGEIADLGAKVVLTVDNGIAAHREAEFLKERGVDLIVTDHHECQGDLPAAVAVIDAKRPDSTYPFSELCGAGIAFKLIQALDQATGGDADLMPYLECAALATVADIVPLRDENRVIASLGIQSMNDGPVNPGIAALKAVSEVDEVTAGRIGFIMAPKINAAGRLGEADRVVELYRSRDAKKTEAIAEFLRDENLRRQQIEQEIFRCAKEKVEAEHLNRQDILLVAGENWHSGVIGIVASRLQEVWYRPVIVAGIDEAGVARGSCRSVPGVDIFAALESCSQLFLTFGGHEQAAGFSIEAQKLPQLREALARWSETAGVAEKLVRTYTYDAVITPEAADFELLDELQLCEPTGIGNPGPVFMLKGIAPDRLTTMGRDDMHLAFSAGDLRFVAFGFGGDCATLARGPFDVLCKLKRHVFRGEESVQAQVVDLRVSPLNDNQTAWELLRGIRRDERDALAPFALWKMGDDQLFPDRKSLITVYKMIDSEKSCVLAFDGVLLQCPDMNSFQLLLGLNALQEAGLIEFHLKRGQIAARKCKINEKKDIQNTPLVLKLKQYLELSRRED